MTRGADGAPIGSDDVGTIADMEENAGGGAAVVAGSSADEDAGGSGWTRSNLTLIPDVMHVVGIGRIESRGAAGTVHD
jgi:hypothetical protein